MAVCPLEEAMDRYDPWDHIPDLFHHILVVLQCKSKRLTRALPSPSVLHIREIRYYYTQY